MRWAILRCDVERRSEPVFSDRSGMVGYGGRAPTIIKLELSGDDDFLEWIWAASQRGEITGGAFPSPRRDTVIGPMPTLQDAVDELSGRVSWENDLKGSRAEATLRKKAERQAAEAARGEPTRRQPAAARPPPKPAPPPIVGDAARLSAIDFGDDDRK